MIKMDFTNPAYTFMSDDGDFGNDVAKEAGPEAYKRLTEIDQYTANAVSNRRKVIDNWHQYGTILNGMRAHLKKDNYFGDWIKENKLDTGKASVQQTRTAAMWVARVWSKGLREWLDAHEDDGYPMTPINLQARIRSEGHEWALDGRNTDKDARYNYNCTSISTPSDASSETTGADAKKARKPVVKGGNQDTKAQLNKVFDKLAKTESEVISLAKAIAADNEADAYISTLEVMISQLTETLNAIKASMPATKLRRVA